MKSGKQIFRWSLHLKKKERPNIGLYYCVKGTIKYKYQDAIFKKVAASQKEKQKQ